MKAWLDRVFERELGTWMLPNVLERVDGTPARVEAVVAALPAALLTRHAGQGWSIQETVGHLLDLEPLWLGRVDDFAAGEPRLRAADLTNRATHEAGHDGAPIESILRGLRDARARLVQRVEALDDGTLERTALHPRLGTAVRVVDLLHFVAEHDDHHLAAVRRLRRAFAAAAPPRRADPAPPLVPILRYQDARAAIAWLCAAFGFAEVFSVPATGTAVRHARLRLGASLVMLGSVRPDDGLASPRAAGVATQALCVFVGDVDAHFERARSAGAQIVSPPHDTGFGSRDYHVLDREGHPWVFSTHLPGPPADDAPGAGAGA